MLDFDILVILSMFATIIASYLIGKARNTADPSLPQFIAFGICFVLFFVLTVHWVVLYKFQNNFMFYEVVVQKGGTEEWLKALTQAVDKVGLWTVAWGMIKSAVLFPLFVLVVVAVVFCFICAVDESAVKSMGGDLEDREPETHGGYAFFNCLYWVICVGFLASASILNTEDNEVRYIAKGATLNAQTQQYLQERCEYINVARVKDGELTCGVGNLGSDMKWSLYPEGVRELLAKADKKMERKDFAVEFTWSSDGKSVTLLAFPKYSTPPMIEPEHMMKVAELYARKLEESVAKRLAKPQIEKEKKPHFSNQWEGLKV